jgi:hypothetical protein
MRLFTSTLIGVMALATLSSASAGAENFQGVLEDKARPVPVVLNLRADAAPGTLAGSIRFGGPWACGLEVELAQVAEQQRLYFLKGAGAGRCAVLTAGYLHTQRDDDGLAVTLFDRANRAPALYSIPFTPVSS